MSKNDFFAFTLQIYRFAVKVVRAAVHFLRQLVAHSAENTTKTANIAPWLSPRPAKVKSVRRLSKEPAAGPPPHATLTTNQFMHDSLNAAQ